MSEWWSYIGRGQPPVFVYKPVSVKGLNHGRQESLFLSWKFALHLISTWLDAPSYKIARKCRNFSPPVPAQEHGAHAHSWYFLRDVFACIQHQHLEAVREAQHVIVVQLEKAKTKMERTRRQEWGKWLATALEGSAGRAHKLAKGPTPIGDILGAGMHDTITNRSEFWGKEWRRDGDRMEQVVCTCLLYTSPSPRD